jgi:hypothetical protein
VSIAKTIFSTIGKLGVVLLLLGAFVVGLGGVMLLSLRSPEMKVPQIVGKELLEGEKELAQFDLKIRKRSDRFSQEKPNTILEQYPLPGETLKAGQTVAVIVSRAEAIGDEKPAEVKKETVQDKPKADDQSEVDKARQKRKANRNANANKPVSTDADGNFNGNANSNKNANSGNSNAVNSNAGNSNSRTNANSRNTNSGGNANNRPAATNANRTSTPAGNRNTNSKPSGGDNRRNQ